jgi:hypothetical protein
MTKPSFIQLRLCDNDFGHQLEQTARLLNEALGEETVLVSPARVKTSAVNLIVALTDLSHAARGFSNDNAHLGLYLLRSLDVVFTDHAPTDDHDGGSVAIDRNTGYIWRF